MAKQAVRVRLIGFASQFGHKSKQIIFKRVNRVASLESGRVDLYFSNKFFFFLENRCNLSIVYEYPNCD